MNIEQNEWIAWLHQERLQVGERNKNKSLMIIKLKNEILDKMIIMANIPSIYSHNKFPQTFTHSGV